MLIAGKAIDESDSDYIYAGTVPGGDKSSDGGHNWEPMNHPSWGSSSIITHSAIAGVVYSSRNDIYKSTDYGDSWQQISSEPFGNFGEGDLAIAPTNPDVLYFCGTWSWSSPDGIYKSTDGGATWQLINNDLTIHKFILSQFILTMKISSLLEQQNTVMSNLSMVFIRQ